MSEAREDLALLFEKAAEDLEAAAKHLRVAARHFRDGDVPRGCAHAFAGRGHGTRAFDSIDEASRRHAERASPT